MTCKVSNSGSFDFISQKITPLSKRYIAISSCTIHCTKRSLCCSPLSISRALRLGEALHALSDQIHREINRTLTEQGYTPLRNEQEAILKGQIRSIRHSHNVVRILLGERINVYVKEFLSLSSPQNRHRALPGGLGPIQTELKEIGTTFSHIMHHNRMVFGPYYSEILAKLLVTEGDTGMDSR